MATASLVIGVVSLILSLALVGLVTGIVGLVLGRKAINRAKRLGVRPSGIALAGSATSSAAVIIGGLLSLVGVPNLIAHRHDFGQFLSCAGKATSSQEAQDCLRRFENKVGGTPTPSVAPSTGVAVNAKPPGKGGPAWVGPKAVTFPAAPPVLGSAPGVAFSGDGHRFVVWASPGGELVETVGVGAGWVAPAVVTGSVTGQPAAAAGASSAVVVAEAGGSLVAGTGSTSRKVLALVALPSGPPGVTPTAVAGTTEGSATVFWRGSDAALWEAPFDGTAWGKPRSLGMGPLASDPSAASDGHGQTSAVWEGVDGELYAAQGNGDTWVGPLHVAGMGPLGSAPAIAVAGTGERFVFWAGANGTLHEAIWDNRAWGGPYDVGIPVGGGTRPATAIEAATGRVWVFWRGPDGTLQQAVSG